MTQGKGLAKVALWPSRLLCMSVALPMHVSHEHVHGPALIPRCECSCLSEQMLHKQLVLN